MKVSTTIVGVSYPALTALAVQFCADLAVPFARDDSDSTQFLTPNGRISLTDDPTGVGLLLDCPDEKTCYELRDSLVRLLAGTLPETAAALTWSDDVEAGALPPNFQIATVLHSAPLGPMFRRITLKLPNPQLFEDDAIHFRVVLPLDNGVDPIWPRLAANGATVWPQGAQALHRPVYTVRHRRDDEIDMDVLLHAGGRLSAWAQECQPGDALAILGPAGAGTLNQSKVLMCGDAAAFPAIARIIEELPEAVTGQVLLCSADGTPTYPIPTCTGISVDWVSQDKFFSAVETAMAASADRYLWIAAGTEVISDLRQTATFKARHKHTTYCASFWGRDGFAS